MEATKTHWPAVVVSAIAGMAIGMLWYGFLFVNQWMAGNDITMEGEKMFKDGVEVPYSNMPMILNTIGMFVYALIINWLLKKSGARTLMDGLVIGGAIGIIGLLGVFIGNAFAAAPGSLSVTDGSYTLVLFSLMGAILGGWQKK